MAAPSSWPETQRESGSGRGEAQRQDEPYAALTTRRARDYGGEYGLSDSA